MQQQEPREGPAMFADRRDAGRQLAARLAPYAGLRPVVIAMPRGGVPVAAEVARRLGAPLDVTVVRKIGCPWQPELGIGAIAEGDVRVLNDELIAESGVGPQELEAVTARERVELARRVSRYRGERPQVPVKGRVAILVDDGLATGYTARAAIAALRTRGAERVILAVPVAPEDSVESMRALADWVVVVEEPAWFFGIGEFYDDFSQTSDDEVVALLEAAAGRVSATSTVPT
jgi:putative phosphoribosyl transferase